MLISSRIHDTNESAVGIRTTVPRITVVNADLRQIACHRLRLLAQNGIALPETDHIPHKIMNLPVFFQSRPVQPGYDIVLTVGIVVAKLRVAELVAAVEHRRSAAAEQRRKRIFHHAPAQSLDLRIVRLSLGTAVPAVSVVVAVRIVPAVFLIVLRIVRVQIIERKTVMTGQEIHRCALTSVHRIVQIRRTDDAVDRGSRHAPVAL